MRNKIMKNISILLLTVTMIMTAVFVGEPEKVLAEETNYEDFAGYKNCKLSDNSKKVTFSVKNDKLVVSGWVSKSYGDDEKGYNMKWKKISKSYKFSENCSFTDSSTGGWKEFKKKNLAEKLKDFGTKYDCVSVLAFNGKVESIDLRNINGRVSSSQNIPSKTENIMIYSQGSAGHFAGEIPPKAYASVSIKGDKLTINGVIYCFGDYGEMIVSKTKHVLTISRDCEGKQYVTKNLKKFKKNSDLMIELAIDKGKIIRIELVNSARV